ncbi:MAG: hypothetical protein K6F07_00140 [Bacilli bacterium]|nr:hypothetical protein [Bacilli bacterium]
MVMKDKLVKNHHKGIYFTMKKWTLILLASATFIVAVVVPTYIMANIQANKTAGIAEEEPSVNEPAITDDSDEDKDEEDPTEEGSDENEESNTNFEYETYEEPHCK